ncbi:MAG: hypothetical protein PHQ52_00265 [Candidatus Omnitrophica bacterium]|nr:hypothetical protein [Candidatus Omnitrophota bacterium]
MKKYQSMKIKKVKLNSDQAIMQVCAIAGSGWYFNPGPVQWCNAGTTDNIGAFCTSGVKGNQTYSRGPGQQHTIPS